MNKDGTLTYVCGSSGSGKSAFVKQQIRKAKRFVVWDIEDEYGANGIITVNNINELLDCLEFNKKQSARVRYVPNGGDIKNQFKWFNKAAFAWEDCAVVCEELASVTNSGKAPEGWLELVSRGRKRGIDIYGVTQRPSEADKTLLGNAHIIHCGLLSRAADRVYMAREMDIDPQEITDLKPLEFWERNNKTRTIKKGKIKF